MNLKNLRLMADATGGGAAVTESKDQIIARLTGELTDAKAQLAIIQAKDEQRIKDETLIAEKMSKGLTRDQAIAVIERQKKFEADKKPTTKAPAKK